MTTEYSVFVNTKTALMGHWRGELFEYLKFEV